MGPVSRVLPALAFRHSATNRSTLCKTDSPSLAPPCSLRCCSAIRQTPCTVFISTIPIHRLQRLQLGRVYLANFVLLLYCQHFWFRDRYLYSWALLLFLLLRAVLCDSRQGWSSLLARHPAESSYRYFRCRGNLEARPCNIRN